MDQTLSQAYKIIFEAEPEAGAGDWQVAGRVVEQFDIRKLGENLAKEVIYAIVLDIHFPNQEKTTEVVGKAEGFAGELWDDLPDEPHMAEIERLERLEKNKPH